MPSIAGELLASLLSTSFVSLVWRAISSMGSAESSQTLLQHVALPSVLESASSPMTSPSSKRSGDTAEDKLKRLWHRLDVRPSSWQQSS